MKSSVPVSSLPRLCLAVVAALLLVVPVALGAEELSRDEYVARLEPICAANSKANSRILKGVKDQVNHGKLGPAGGRFIRASAALARSVRQMAKVPKPTADQAKLTKWFGYLKHEQRYLQLIGKSLKSGNKYRASKLASQLNRNNNKANNTIITFGFKECRIESSRFV